MKKKSGFIAVKNADHLKALCLTGHDYFFVANGAIRSSMDVQYDVESDTFWVTHCIDDTEENVTMKQMRTKKSWIGELLNTPSIWTTED